MLDGNDSGALGIHVMHHTHAANVHCDDMLHTTFEQHTDRHIVPYTAVNEVIVADLDRFEDGKTVWSPYLWLFWQRPDDILNAMTKWPWFNQVHEDERYSGLLEKAKEMAESK